MSHTQLCRLSLRETRENSPTGGHEVYELLRLSSNNNVRHKTRKEYFRSLAHFSSRYNSPKLIRAVSYSLMAASDVTEGGFDTMSL